MNEEIRNKEYGLRNQNWNMRTVSTFDFSLSTRHYRVLILYRDTSSAEATNIEE
jgi:hypothetical protein